MKVLSSHQAGEEGLENNEGAAREREGRVRRHVSAPADTAVSPVDYRTETLASEWHLYVSSLSHCYHVSRVL